VATYTFGDSDLAANRLRLLARVFAPSSRVFISEAVKFRPRLALDLGSGLGDTTLLLADVLTPEATVGIERSRSFLKLAEREAGPGISFVEHDVTKLPFPTGTADLIYSRFLLTHLPRPESVIAGWITQLCPGGLLLLEEVERIETADPVLRRYLEVVETMMRDHGQELYVGARLAALGGGECWSLRANGLRSVAPPVDQAARMFEMNLAGWRNDPSTKKIASKAEVDRLADGLTKIAARRGADSPEITWGMRQVVLKRGHEAS
jgi:trans-aconitate 2-methyltransferase